VEEVGDGKLTPPLFNQGHFEDAGASLHLSMHQLDFMHGVHSRKERCHPLIFSSRIQDEIQAFIEDKMEGEKSCFRTSWR
jgi:hypothetical protein